MKYIEELTIGDAFKIDNEFFLLTSDFKKDNTRLCCNLNNGLFRWIKNDSIVEISPLYVINEQSAIVSIKN